MGAPKGNKYAIGNNGGRPRMYETPEEMQIAIDEYFESIKPVVVFKEKLSKEDYIKPKETIWDNGKPIGYSIIEKQGEPATINGLAIYIGFADRHSLYEYQERKEFTTTIKNARARVEKAYEESLSTGNPAGAIFALKNMGWSDKVDLNHGGQEGNPVKFINLGDGEAIND